jgi:hypothetical protein
VVAEERSRLTQQAVESLRVERNAALQVRNCAGLLGSFLFVVNPSSVSIHAFNCFAGCSTAFMRVLIRAVGKLFVAPAWALPVLVSGRPFFLRLVPKLRAVPVKPGRTTASHQPWCQHARDKPYRALVQPS